MTYYVWIVPGRLAVSPMPTINEIPELAEVFDGVVVLIQPHEAVGMIDQYLQTWTSSGVEVYYLPTPDFHPVDLLHLYKVSRWIHEIIAGGGRVLVHCMGGVGRSGLVAAAYLVYTGKDLYHAVSRVTSLRPGALSIEGQRRMLEDFYILMKTINTEIFEYIMNMIEESRPPIKHLSKSLQFTIEVCDYLDVKIDEGLLYASLLHCVDRLHDMKAVNKEICGKYRLGEAARILKEYWLDADTVESIILHISHILDLGMDGRVVVLLHDLVGPVNYITALCDWDCSRLIEHAREYVDKLSRLTGKKILLQHAPYSNYI